MFLNIIIHEFLTNCPPDKIIMWEYQLFKISVIDFMIYKRNKKEKGLENDSEITQLGNLTII